MAVAEVNHAWDHIWQQKPAFLPVNIEHDSIGTLIGTLVDALPTSTVTFLDIGSGPGSRTIPIIGSRSDIQLILLDQSSEALSLAKEHANKQGVKASYVRADGFTLPFADASLSCVFANGVNEHFVDPLRQGLITEMTRVTESNGSVAIMVPNKLNPFHTANKRVREMNGTWPFGPQYDFTPTELRERMGRAGLTDITSYGVGTFTSWIRALPKDSQNGFYNAPTPYNWLNNKLWKLDANTTSPLNQALGREILVMGRKLPAQK
ncbi:hypothetical protein BH11PAT1_BH11PAT1_3030 [soil metagenome]